MPLSAKLVASGFSRPVFATAPPGEMDRLFVVEQFTGKIRILNTATGVIGVKPFLQVPGLSTANEQGLLGLAFAPGTRFPCDALDWPVARAALC